MREPTSVAGVVVAVTGGARGIGLAVAEVLVAAGARVAIGDLDSTAARGAAARLGRGTGGLGLDVTDTPSFTAFLDGAERALGAIDVLVNNAGVMWGGPFAAETDAVAARQIEVNLLGVIRGTRLAAVRMAARGRGHVITIASAASKLAPPGEATYAATKHGVHGYLSAVRAELRRSGVRVSLVMPGVVDTELAAGTRTGPVRRLQPHQVAEVVLDVVRRPRFETVVPRQIALLHKVSAVLPQPARDLLLRIVLPDQVAAVRRGATRTGYQSSTFELLDHFDGSP